MPICDCGYNLAAYRQASARLAAWTAHYRAKGCSSTKAEDVARRKCRGSSTWPPEKP